MAARQVCTAKWAPDKQVGNPAGGLGGSYDLFKKYYKSNCKKLHTSYKNTVNSYHSLFEHIQKTITN